jgi:ketosteroid isomerase-like protein
MGADDVQALQRFYQLAGAALPEMSANPRACTDIGAAVERGELPNTAAMLEAFDPEVEWVPLEAEGKVFYGRAGMIAILEAWFEAMDQWSVQPEEIVDADGSLLMTIRVKARGRSSGVSIEELGYAVFAMRDGKVLRCDEFADLEAAREAVRLLSSRKGARG